MEKNIALLDCTLRDGAYITESKFGEAAIKGIIKKLSEAGAEIIECGWLKDSEHVYGSTYYHVPDDLKNYIDIKTNGIIYSAMIDWNRYNLDYLPECDHQSIDAIRVVFPYGKHVEGAEVARKIREKGYDIYLQAANTLAYNDDDLIILANTVNELCPKGLSIVDTFGAMYPEDLERIMGKLNKLLHPSIALGLHTHNNQQLAFAHVMHFVSWMTDNSKRKIIIDSSLSGMGRGAGNATTELVTSYLNRKHNGSYDLNAVMDAIDTYMEGFHQKYEWGYSTPYCIAGIYCCHVNNIAYLLNNHRTSAQDMRNIIESLDASDRRAYDYDLLERKYLENQSRIVDDDDSLSQLKNNINGRPVLLIAPGKSIVSERDRVNELIMSKKPIVMFVNALNTIYKCDYSIFTNKSRFEYAETSYRDVFNDANKILFSNIKTTANEKEYIINYNRVIKRGWHFFDNAVILSLRLLEKLNANIVYLAGFDGFKQKYNDSYFDESLPTLNTENNWEDINREVKEMFNDFLQSYGDRITVKFVTQSEFDN